MSSGMAAIKHEHPGNYRASYGLTPKLHVYFIMRGRLNCRLLALRACTRRDRTSPLTGFIILHYIDEHQEDTDREAEG